MTAGKVFVVLGILVALAVVAGKAFGVEFEAVPALGVGVMFVGIGVLAS